MRNKTFVLGASAALLALMVWWLSARPQLIIALETHSGKSSLIYRCTITTDAAEAEARAKAAHVALQTQAKVIGTDAATKVLAAMQAYHASGDIPDFDPIEATSHAQLRALKADIKNEFGCDVDVFSLLRRKPAS